MKSLAQLQEQLNTATDAEGVKTVTNPNLKFYIVPSDPNMDISNYATKDVFVLVDGEFTYVFSEGEITHPQAVLAV